MDVKPNIIERDVITQEQLVITHDEKSIITRDINPGLWRTYYHGCKAKHNRAGLADMNERRYGIEQDHGTIEGPPISLIGGEDFLTA